jgi:hypothetical protein
MTNQTTLSCLVCTTVCNSHVTFVNLGQGLICCYGCLEEYRQYWTETLGELDSRPVTNKQVVPEPSGYTFIEQLEQELFD